MMLVSANDSLFALAEFICGSLDKFAVMMQEKAKSIGAADTTITTADGRFTAEQYSNAYDLAIICRYCMTNRMINIRSRQRIKTAQGICRIRISLLTAETEDTDMKRLSA